MAKSHQDKVAVISGAANGIGQAFAQRLAQDGAHIVIADMSPAAETVQLVKKAGRDVLAWQGDVSSESSVNALLTEVTARFGRCDILVNCAGIFPSQPFAEMTFTDWRRVQAVNLDSVFLMCAAFVPGMRARKWGRIVNISSGAARGAGAIGVHYNASKAGMEGLTRGYAARLVKEGITVNAVAPSLIETDMMGGRTDLARNIPLGRMGQADEVAQAVAMVLGNSYMTGQTIVLNGGMAFI
jgi:3-oxoacyl-[acyl-carrier protein] reductase